MAKRLLYKIMMKQLEKKDNYKNKKNERERELKEKMSINLY